MAKKVVFLDTSILIDYYRKTDKNNAVWVSLVRQDYDFAISVITTYEIYSGATKEQRPFWDDIMTNLLVFPFDEACAETSVRVNEILKRKSKQIAILDLFIASTSLEHNLPIATLNIKHFDRVPGLTIIDPPSSNVKS